MWSDTETIGGNILWYLVHCQPRKETYAANSLRHILNLSVFFPESWVRSRGITRCSPFFPGYIFVHANLQETSKSRINTCPGVLRLVEFGGGPQSVSQHVIDTISQQLDRLNGLPPAHLFNPGDIVQVKHGPLKDLEMIFIRPVTPGGRVHVLLELLGRLKEVQVDMDVLEKAPVSSLVSHELNAQRERYTLVKSKNIQRSS
jgi:transcription antitermination factor NusG